MSTAERQSLLVIIPALNEAGAIGSVVTEVREAVPQSDVLVIDDCSSDGTGSRARAAGARVLTLPYHLGLGGAVQAGYKLAYELGYEYVIRVDGDGQHNPRDIPRVLDRLITTHCEMVIGSRFVERNGSKATRMRGAGILFFRAVLRPVLGQWVYDPTSGFVGVNRRALKVFARSFPLSIPRSRRWWCCSASGSDFRKFPVSFVRENLVSPPSPD